MRAFLCSCAIALGLLSANAALAADSPSEAPVDVAAEPGPPPAVEIGEALQVARGRLVRASDGSAWLLLSTGSELEVRWPDGVSLPLGRMVLVGGIPDTSGPLRVDRVIVVR